MSPTAAGLRVVVLGAAGKMGQRVVAAVHEAGFTVHSAVDRPGSPAHGVDAGLVAGVGALGVRVTSDFPEALRGADVVIDFTEAAASVASAGVCAAAGVPIVVATTGLSADQKTALAAAATKIPILFEIGRAHV